MRVKFINILIRILMGRDYSDKLDRLIRQGMIHADAGTGPLLKRETKTKEKQL